jgi:hypothetical protein
MDTLLQESGGLMRTSPIQSPVPVAGTRISLVGRIVLGSFVVVLALGYLVQLLPLPSVERTGRADPVGALP